eukprot:5296245-Amphidinium_carterae.1
MQTAVGQGGPTTTQSPVQKVTYNVSSITLTLHGSRADKAKWTSTADTNYLIEFGRANYRHSRAGD